MKKVSWDRQKKPMLLLAMKSKRSHKAEPPGGDDRGGSVFSGLRGAADLACGEPSKRKVRS